MAKVLLLPACIPEVPCLNLEGDTNYFKPVSSSPRLARLFERHQITFVNYKKCIYCILIKSGGYTTYCDFSHLTRIAAPNKSYGSLAKKDWTPLFGDQRRTRDCMLPSTLFRIYYSL